MMFIVIAIALILLPLLLSGSLKHIFKKPVFDDVYLFEEFVYNDFFTEEFYQAKHFLNSPGEIITDEDAVPDFKFSQKKTGFEFFIKAKHVAGNTPGKIIWCTDAQYLKYKFLKGIPLYVIIGMGGKQLLPEKLFLIPAKQITAATFDITDYTQYEITDASFIDFSNY